MHSRIPSLILVAALGAAAVLAARAQNLVVEPLPFMRFNSQGEYWFWFPNVVDSFYRERVTFTGTATASNARRLDGINISFGWADPALGELRWVYRTWIDPDTHPQVFTVSWVLPFCPPELGLYVGAFGATSYYIEDEVFIHEGLIPEPTGCAVFAGLGMIGFAVLRRSRRAACVV